MKNARGTDDAFRLSSTYARFKP